MRCTATASSCELARDAHRRGASGTTRAVKAEGRVIRILERGSERIVGRYERDDGGMRLRRAVRSTRAHGHRQVPRGQEGGAARRARW